MLHLVYRSSGGTNLKNRPEFFDKVVALASFLRAVDAAGGPREVIFLNDGPVPAERARLMPGAGRVVETPGLGNSGSYLRALEEVLRSPWPESDLVYLSEDDYLYLPESFVALTEASVALPQASYFTLYDHRDRYTRDDDADGGRARLFLAGERHWRTVESTCMSYAARVGALREDAGRHRRAARGSIPDDRDLWRRLQKLGRHRWRPGPRRMLVAPIPGLATHLETEYLAPAVDWRAAAADARRWLASRAG